MMIGPERGASGAGAAGSDGGAHENAAASLEELRAVLRSAATTAALRIQRARLGLRDLARGLALGLVGGIVAIVLLCAAALSVLEGLTMAFTTWTNRAWAGPLLAGLTVLLLAWLANALSRRRSVAHSRRELEERFGPTPAGPATDGALPATRSPRSAAAPLQTQEIP